jgi:hypothetical protein
VVAGSVGLFFVILALLAFQLRAGKDPAIGAGEPRLAAAAAPQVLVRRVIETRIVEHRPAGGATAPRATRPAPVQSAPPAPAPPLTTRSS